jgi:hypothetical protein
MEAEMEPGARNRVSDDGTGNSAEVRVPAQSRD